MLPLHSSDNAQLSKESCATMQNAVNPMTVNDFNNTVASPIASKHNSGLPNQSQPSSSSFVIQNNNSFTSLIPLKSQLSQPSDAKIDTETQNMNSSTLLTFMPAAGDTNSSTSHEKITVKLKKSETVPNEMVVVGSLRHVQEQKRYSFF